MKLGGELAQPLRGPDAELRGLVRFHPVAHRDDDIEVVSHDLVGFPIGGSSCIICTYCFLRQFSFLENITNVLGDDGAFPLEQVRHLRLRQPDRFLLQPHLQAGAPVLRLVEDDRGWGRWCVTHFVSPPIIVRMRSVTPRSSASISASGRGGWKT